MGEQNEATGPDEEFDPRLSEEDRESLVRLRRAKAEAKGTGRWQTEPMDDPYDKFGGPFGVHKDGDVLVSDPEDVARPAGED